MLWYALGKLFSPLFPLKFLFFFKFFGGKGKIESLIRKGQADIIFREFVNVLIRHPPSHSADVSDAAALFFFNFPNKMSLMICQHIPGCRSMCKRWRWNGATLSLLARSNILERNGIVGKLLRDSIETKKKKKVERLLSFRTFANRRGQVIIVW